MLQGVKVLAAKIGYLRSIFGIRMVEAKNRLLSSCLSTGFVVCACVPLPSKYNNMFLKSFCVV